MPAYTPHSEWTADALTVVARAEREAVTRGHRCVRSEHYLYALLEADGPRTVLATLDVPVDRLRHRVGEVLAGELPGTSDVPRVLEAARFEMDLEEIRYLSTEHLLIGVAVEGDGLLDEAGATPDRLREGTYQVFRSAVYGPPPAFGHHAVTVPPALRALDDELGVLARHHEAPDDELLARRRDLVSEWSGWVDTVRVVREAELLRAEVRRLHRLLRTHGVDPGR
ncbi:MULTISPECIES: Clp protease N-terminal domain-containing protein [Actinoplanes]|uniref:Clp R domain-containing protein n=2 Tax=Actinoplanes TaxID=1865 RepID=A0A101JPM9_9ACTN|nr:MULTISPECIES: Clp protease N-terminal domain-containing protein [Actinoplanes]KUL30720.1 hypothetical protein ADL15_24030 [Actinoplanes awajinensis subsp. mycoplanecinus]GIE73228.1 hypothetical protein Apa02nite_093360 [Actinoplanes palleronii]